MGLRDRHPVPDEHFDTTHNAQEDEKSKQSPVKEMESQEARDAHFYEDGVKPDGTGGTPPESEEDE